MNSEIIMLTMNTTLASNRLAMPLIGSSNGGVAPLDCLRLLRKRMLHLQTVFPGLARTSRNFRSVAHSISRMSSLTHFSRTSDIR